MTVASRRDAIVLYGLIGCMVLFWSGNYIAAKIALRAMPPLLVTSLRITLAGFFILPFYFRQQSNARTRDRWSRREAPSLIALGVLGVMFNQLLFVLGISLTSVAHAGMMIALTPLCVLTLAVWMGMERITWACALGMLTALAGVAVLETFRGGAGAARPSASGDIIVFLGAVTFSLFTVFNKRIALRRTGTTVNTFAYAGSAILLIPLTAFELSRHNISHAGFAAWAALVYMAAFSSVSAYLIYSWALSRVPASQLAAFSYMQPLIAIVLAAFILNEAITPPIAGAGILILGGVAIIERARTVARQEARAAA